MNHIALETFHHPHARDPKRTQAFTLVGTPMSYGFVLPGPNEQVLPGVMWGSPSELFTPAYWVSQAWLQERTGQVISNRMGESLIEETAACILGGYGIRAEVGVAAFEKLRERNLLSGRFVTELEILAALGESLLVDGREVRYRFLQQRSRYLSEAINGILAENPPNGDIELRNWLLKFPGVGLKTASWITRNWKESDCVAIIDVHLLRAGRIIGLFGEQKPSTDYLELEDLFLSFARSVNVRASVLDSIIWYQMRTWSNLVPRPA
ncbi:MAG: hypothetical protein WCD49_14025 [Candidatus Acidiferrales bacterium]